ncbi:SPASM domain-containing protein, partial [Myxococcota bacterium]|nr:SPASM domain-containing protein [Myxococcota bacterium]
KKLATLLKDCNVRRLIIIGGEPTLWSHLFEFNEFCKQIGLKTQMVTNALRFSDNSFWNEYQERPNDLIGVSLKGYDARSYKEVTGISDFTSVSSGLKRALNFFECGISTVYSSADGSELVKTAHFAKEVGANYLSVGLCTPSITKEGISGKFLAKPTDVVSGIVNYYQEVTSIMGDKMGFSMKLPLCLLPNDFLELLISKKQISTLCQLRHKTGLIFGVDGEVIVCNTLYDYPIGKFGKDFTTKNGLMKFLNSPTISGYYDKLNNYPSEKCISCKRYSTCGGGCPMFWSYYKADEVITGFD